MTENEMLIAIYNDMQEVKQQMQEMKTELRGEMQEIKTELQDKMQEMKTELQDKMQEMNVRLQNQITDIKLTLENEVSKNINIIAEGHLELSRKLDEAVRVNNETELMKIRLNIVENDVRRLKVQIA